MPVCDNCEFYLTCRIRPSVYNVRNKGCSSNIISVRHFDDMGPVRGLGLLYGWCVAGVVGVWSILTLRRRSVLLLSFFDTQTLIFRTADRRRVKSIYQTFGSKSGTKN